MRRCGLALLCGLMVALFLVSGSVVVPQAPSGVTVVDEKTAGDVTLKVGTTLEVRLEANHTTGYSWVQTPAANPVLERQGKAKYQQGPTDGKAGAGGVELWKFKAAKAGKQNLRFEYRRPWEKSASPAKTLTFDVTVD